jgi:hypothetical protein
LGAGTVAKNYKGLYKGHEVAIKFVKCVNSEGEIKEFKQELALVR